MPAISLCSMMVDLIISSKDPSALVTTNRSDASLLSFGSMIPETVKVSPVCQWLKTTLYMGLPSPALVMPIERGEVYDNFSLGA